jgi:hypothetical protein
VHGRLSPAHSFAVNERDLCPARFAYPTSQSHTGAKMDKLKGQLVLDLMAGEISEETFVSRFGADPRVSPDVVYKELQQALAEKSDLGVECALILGSIFGLSPSWASTLCRLLDEDWHFSHEDIADTLQDIRAPSSVDSLYRAALKKHDYLAYNESQHWRSNAFGLCTILGRKTL